MNNQFIFFSYSRSDASDFALKLATELKNAGINVWIDQLDIPVGRAWDIEIEKALERANCVIFILSNKSVSSDNVLNEIGYALDEEKQVIPILISDCKIPIRVRRLQHIDFRSNYFDGLAKLLKDVQVPDEEASSLVKQLKANRLNAKRSLWTDYKGLLVGASAFLLLAIILAIFLFRDKPIKDGSFECSNLSAPDSMWVIRARINGNYAIYDKKLRLELQSGWITLTNRKNLPQENLTIASIRPSLVAFTDMSGRWDYVFKGDKQLINKKLSGNDTLRLDVKNYDIPFVNPVNLNRSWVVFDVVLRSDTQTEGTIPLQSLPDLF